MIETSEIQRQRAAEVARAVRGGAEPQKVLEALMSRLLAEPASEWAGQGHALLNAGMPPAAALLFNSALHRWPEHFEFAYWMGVALQAGGDLENAESAYRDVLRVRPEHDGAATALAGILRDVGRYSEAASLMDRLARRLMTADAVLSCGSFIEQCQQYTIAGALYKDAEAAGLRSPSLTRARGEVAMILGDFADARDKLVSALDAGLNVDEWPGTWMLLANAKRFETATDPDLARLTTAWEAPELSSKAKSVAGFALAKAHDDLGDFEASAQILYAANRLERDSRNWSAEKWQSGMVSETARVYAKAWDGELPGNISPIFVVGLPRTGTTLISDILGRHPGVQNRGELTGIQYLHRQLLVNERFRSSAAMQKASLIYCAQLRRDDTPVRWYIDKNPHNFQYLKMIAALFPGAKVIHCRRGARDTALSIWSQRFSGQGTGYAYDWSDITRFMQGYDRWMAAWHAEPGLPTFTLDYEQMVREPDSTIRQVSEFIGLPGFDLLGARPKAENSVVTASIWQVRQPISARTVGRWRRYAPFVPELNEWID